MLVVLHNISAKRGQSQPCEYQAMIVRTSSLSQLAYSIQRRIGNVTIYIGTYKVVGTISIVCIINRNS